MGKLRGFSFPCYAPLSSLFMPSTFFSFFIHYICFILKLLVQTYSAKFTNSFPCSEFLRLFHLEGLQPLCLCCNTINLAYWGRCSCSRTGTSVFQQIKTLKLEKVLPSSAVYKLNGNWEIVFGFFSCPLVDTNFSLMSQHLKFSHWELCRTVNPGTAGKLERSRLMFTGLSILVGISLES